MAHDNEKYYRRIKQGKRVRYVPIGMLTFGTPACGIWYVADVASGLVMTRVEERLEDLPRARVFASLEPYRPAICQILCNEQQGKSVNEVASAIFKVFAEGLKEAVE